MAKRLTDTAKWKNPWFRKLPTKYKVLFLYLLDECDNAGVIHIDFEILSFLLKEDFNQIEFDSFFGEKITYISENKIIINNYIRFQNGDISSDKNPMARHINKELNRHGILEKYRNGDFGRGVEWV